MSLLVRGRLNVLDQKAETPDPKFPLVLGQSHDGEGFQVEVGAVEDDEASPGLDVLSVVRPLHEVARVFSGPEK